MPQDTIWTGEAAEDFYVLDSIPGSTYKHLPAHTVILSPDQQFRKTSDNYSQWAPLYTFILLAVIWVLIRLIHGKSKSYVEVGSGADEEESPGVPGNTQFLVYEGRSLNFNNQEINSILKRRLPYFNTLSGTDKDKFIFRIQKFMKQKTFKIHDDSGFKEMPMLISAAAIQFSLGMEKYLLPDFPFIHIFPNGFLGIDQTIRYLEGNVSDNSINISWKHFLNGYQYPSDGQNVGLHEKAHAYYIQKFCYKK
ncbi:MAG: zinc-dependent peptidase [Ferruginibacter sp.]